MKFVLDFNFLYLHKVRLVVVANVGTCFFMSAQGAMFGQGAMLGRERDRSKKIGTVPRKSGLATMYCGEFVIASIVRRRSQKGLNGSSMHAKPTSK